MPAELCARLVVLPVSVAGGSLIVALVEAGNKDAIDELARSAGYNIEPVLATESQILDAIATHYPGD